MKFKIPAVPLHPKIKRFRIVSTVELEIDTTKDESEQESRNRALLRAYREFANGEGSAKVEEI